MLIIFWSRMPFWACGWCDVITINHYAGCSFLPPAISFKPRFLYLQQAIMLDSAPGHCFCQLPDLTWAALLLLPSTPPLPSEMFSICSLPLWLPFTFNCTCLFIIPPLLTPFNPLTISLSPSPRPSFLLFFLCSPPLSNLPDFSSCFPLPTPTNGDWYADMLIR